MTKEMSCEPYLKAALQALRIKYMPAPICGKYSNFGKIRIRSVAVFHKKCCQTGAGQDTKKLSGCNYFPRVL
jgi:hypothetical protein